MGSEKETTHKQKGCTSTKGADGSSSVDGKMAEVFRIDANKNMTNDKGCRREKGAGAHKLGRDLQSQMSPCTSVLHITSILFEDKGSGP